MIEKFNVGLLDLLSILLPGGFLAGLAWQSGWLEEWSMLQELSESWLSAAAFAASSYVLGHFIHMVASYLDGLLFEKIKKRRWPDETLVNIVIKIKDEEIGKIDRKYFNAFKWSLAHLMQHQPAMYQAVEKHIAESKFFRSFVIVLLFAGAWAFFQNSWLEGSLCLLFAFLSLIRYASQRQKSIDSAYQYVIASMGKKREEKG
ncbi:hypothetical protein J0A67_11220 [Algoriphagus aestuariicola]|uniref:Uncharacterized protein n=1 Tax=Algoriphagus aestuariicola TaxID=1852016 RepID=A0ABS3BUP9_9BACT|nr:hypothetical protein [Algoriphagus aestuariicola]MBN7801434.1 hypothetical protein [Algoriphagus aestuariicola]